MQRTVNDKIDVISLNFPSFYVKDYETAIAFYTRVFGPPQSDRPRIKGWKLGDTWLTLFPSEDMGHDPDANPLHTKADSPTNIMGLPQLRGKSGA